jgi:hypothetical protein
MVMTKVLADYGAEFPVLWPGRELSSTRCLGTHVEHVVNPILDGTVIAEDWTSLSMVRAFTVSAFWQYRTRQFMFILPDISAA